MCWVVVCTISGFVFVGAGPVMHCLNLFFVVGRVSINILVLFCCWSIWCCLIFIVLVLLFNFEDLLWALVFQIIIAGQLGVLVHGIDEHEKTYNVREKGEKREVERVK